MTNIFGNNWVLGIIILAILSLSAIFYFSSRRKKLLTPPSNRFKDKKAGDLVPRSNEVSKQREKCGLGQQKIKNEMPLNTQESKFERTPSTELMGDKESELRKSSETVLKTEELTKEQESMSKKSNNLKLSDEEKPVEKKREAAERKEEKARKERENRLNERKQPFSEKTSIESKDSLTKEAHVLLHPIRFRIVELLAEKPMHINEISKAVGEERRLISYHLNTLEEYGFVSSKHEISQDQKSKGKAIRKYWVTDKVREVTSGIKREF